MNGREAEMRNYKLNSPAADRTREKERKMADPLRYTAALPSLVLMEGFQAAKR